MDILQLATIIVIVVIVIVVAITLKKIIDLEDNLDKHIANKKMHEC